ncbi:MULTISPECIES: alpha-L-fucosidase [unclassified Microbacterium]|uniref:alpha-L-fucosidase n=1 Tax=unclassified Microbacterium TaxID=2609290 RepID=UPI0012F86209|nr:alpha-L-fucosidase [Microbacterium sp. MAH-37]MVQ41472.1 alpha-L-fucosidase [Microbacterium sp. MAH-37]
MTQPRISRRSEQQILQDFVDMRFGMFLHYSLGTYTDEEWARPHQDPALFAPQSVDCAQWAAAAKSAKMEYAVLTTKHHDGFSLWPTQYGTQNVQYSGHREDVVRNYVDSFRAAGLKIGFYFSIWDRTAGFEAQGGHHVSDPTKQIEPAHVDVILGQLTELLTNYGRIDVLLTDGYTWQAGQQAVSIARVRELVKGLQPDCVLADICAVTQPWLGDAIFWEEPMGIRVPAGNVNAGVQGQTISDGWFWHPSTPTEELMSVADIIDHLNETEPRYTSFLLNCPPNRRGRLDENVVDRLAEVGTAWAGPDLSREPLPPQQVRTEWPVIPVAACATFWNSASDLYEVPYNAIDGRGDKNLETCWSTWMPTGGALPASLIVDLGGVWSNVTTFEYLPKQWNRNGATDGDVRQARVLTSVDGIAYELAADVTWASGATPKVAEWPARDVAYVKFEILAGTGGYSNVTGIKVGGRLVKPERAVDPRKDTTIQLRNRASGRYLADDGRVVAQVDEAARWILREAEEGYWWLEAENTGFTLTLNGAGRTAGASVHCARRERSHRQFWALTRIEDGSVILTNRFNMLTLGAGAEGATVSLRDPSLGEAETKWEITVVAAAGEAMPHVRERSDGIAFAAKRSEEIEGARG